MAVNLAFWRKPPAPEAKAKAVRAAPVLDYGERYGWKVISDTFAATNSPGALPAHTVRIAVIVQAYANNSGPVYLGDVNGQYYALNPGNERKLYVANTGQLYALASAASGNFNLAIFGT